jgi:hypothetical protein
MVGFDSKRKMAASRHCDDETMAHIIDLRKRLSDAETQRDNSIDVVMDLRRENAKLIRIVQEVTREQ